MIDNPENGHIPEMRDKEAEPAENVRTATTVAEPNAQTSQPDEVRSRQTKTPMTEPAQTAQSAGDQQAPVAERLPTATEPVSEVDFSSELSKFRQRFEEIQAEFIAEPHAAVEKAETLIDNLVDALRNQLQHIHGKVESETDTEQLRVAMLSYRDLFDSLGGHRAA